jgi:hypothetical protein
MDTATQELIYQLIGILITGIFGVIGFYAKKLITTNIDIAKYGFENEKVERIVENAVYYGEQKAKEFAKAQAVKIAGSEKLTIAKGYINNIDKSIIEKYGTQIDDMVARKVAQKLGV